MTAPFKIGDRVRDISQDMGEAVVFAFGTVSRTYSPDFGQPGMAVIWDDGSGGNTFWPLSDFELIEKPKPKGFGAFMRKLDDPSV